jgi:hypothetical protein
MGFLNRDNFPKKIFFEFFSSISWGLCAGTKCEKVVLFGFWSTGTKGEFRIFEEQKFNFSLLVSTDTKTEKYHFFAFGTGTNT